MSVENRLQAGRGLGWAGRRLLFGCAAGWMMCGVVGVGAQTMARPGWAGSGMRVERWWRHAVVVDVPASEGAGADSEWKGVVDRLDGMRTVGVDALLLRGVGAEVAPGVAGETDGVDDLLREASRRGLRVLVELRGEDAGVGAAARSWAARGAAGFVVTGGGAEALRTVRAAVRGVPGDRVLVSAGAADAGAELRMVAVAGLSPQPDAGLLRAAMAGLPSGTVPAMLTAGTPPPAMAVARVAAAAVLLGAPGASLLEEEWMDGGGAGAAEMPHSVMAQMREFSALHHDRPAFREGTTTVLDHTSEGAVVWVRRGPGGAVMVVAANLGAAPVKVSLVGDMAGLRLRGTFLKTVSRSDNGLGGMPLEAVALPGFGVYVGELSR